MSASEDFAKIRETLASIWDNFHQPGDHWEEHWEDDGGYMELLSAKGEFKAAMPFDAYAAMVKHAEALKTSAE